MEILKLLAVGYVGFPAGNILYVLRIDDPRFSSGF
jgi:hypothetical protein